LIPTQDSCWSAHHILWQTVTTVSNYHVFIFRVSSLSL